MPGTRFLTYIIYIDIIHRKFHYFSIHFAKIAILFQKTIYVLRFLCNFLYSLATIILTLYMIRLLKATIKSK